MNSPVSTLQMSIERISIGFPVAGMPREAEVGSPADEPANHPLTRYYQVLHRAGEIGEGREELGPEDPVAFTSIVHERVVVDIVERDEVVDSIRVVIDQHPEETLGEDASATWLSDMAFFFPASTLS